MTSPAKLPSAVYHCVGKRGQADCAVAALAFVLRRSYEETLIAAARVAPTVWHGGLTCPDMTKVCKRLNVTARWVGVPADMDDEIGVLWVNYHDVTKQHCVVLLEGWIFDVDHDPVSVWRVDEYMTANNAYPVSLLVIKE